MYACKHMPWGRIYPGWGDAALWWLSYSARVTGDIAPPLTMVYVRARNLGDFYSSIQEPARELRLYESNGGFMARARFHPVIFPFFFLIPPPTNPFFHVDHTKTPRSAVQVVWVHTGECR